VLSFDQDAAELPANTNGVPQLLQLSNQTIDDTNDCHYPQLYLFVCWGNSKHFLVPTWNGR